MILENTGSREILIRKLKEIIFKILWMDYMIDLYIYLNFFYYNKLYFHF